MRVNDPKALFGSEILDAGSEALKSKLLKLYEAISHNKENDFDFNVNSCEKVGFYASKYNGFYFSFQRSTPEIFPCFYRIS